MRAIRSDDTLLDGCLFRPLPSARSAGRCSRPLCGSGFCDALLNFGAIYYAVAERARDVAITSARQRTAIALSRPMAYHPEIQHLFSEMQLELESMWPHVERWPKTAQLASIMARPGR